MAALAKRPKGAVTEPTVTQHTGRLSLARSGGLR